uniref:Zgc:152951 n=1 Tax=Neolamprologus brichardi TaxID=32507 RepID=A0A3Q4M7Q9_NEOBR
MGDYESSAPGRITVYSIQGCPHCTQAKATLARLGVPVCDIDLGSHSELRAKVKELTGRSTVPQIFFNNVHVGGNDDLQKLSPEELQRLASLVKEEPLPANAPPLPQQSQSEHTALENEGEFTCERDELADLVEDLKHASMIGSHRRGLTLYKKSFSGSQLVDWLQKEKGMARAAACNTGQALLKKKYMIRVHGCEQQDGNFGEGKDTMDALYRLLEDDSALNAGQTATCSPMQAAELSLLLREMILKLFSEHLSADGKVALPDAEPLIHFALNCGAKGCPPIKTYTPQDIDSQLRTAAEAFLENDDACVVDSVKKEVHLSQIFKWYKTDFGGTDEKLLGWVLDHMGDSPKKTSLQGIVSAGKTKVSFLPYDWSSNSTH